MGPSIIISLSVDKECIFNTEDGNSLEEKKRKGKTYFAWPGDWNICLASHSNIQCCLSHNAQGRRIRKYHDQ